MKRKGCIAMSIRMLWIPQVSKETWTKCSSSPSPLDVISLHCCSQGSILTAPALGQPGILWDGLGPHFLAALPGTPRNPAGP